MKKVISIAGMSCGHCANTVEKALRAVFGVKEASVDLASKKATVEIEGTISDELLKKAVTDAGYQVVEIQ